MTRIVVGVDGSAGSSEALRWAVDEAARRHATLEVVHTWHAPSYDGYLAVAIDPEPFRQAAERVLAATIAGVDAVDDQPKVDARLICGGAGPELVEAAKGAELVVVGSRGRGGFAGMLLGSVSQYVLRHASCPVVVIHQPAGGAE